MTATPNPAEYPDVDPRGAVYAVLPPAEYSALARQAERRSCSPECLASRLLSEALELEGRPMNTLLESGMLEDTLSRTRCIIAVIASANAYKEKWDATGEGVSFLCGMIDDALEWHLKQGGLKS